MGAKVLHIAAAQLKFRRSLPENVEHIRSIVAEAARAGCDAVLFPECAVTGYNEDFRHLSRGEVEKALKAIAGAARACRCCVLIGSPTFDRGRWFNSLLVFDRWGREAFRYHKIHLTARDAEFFTPGNSVALFAINGVRCTAIICHERRFPELVRLPVMMGAQIVFHPNAGLMLSRSRKQSAADATALRQGRLRIRSSTYSRIRSDHKAADGGPQGTPKLSRRIRGSLPWRTIAMRCSSTRALICQRRDASTRAKP